MGDGRFKKGMIPWNKGRIYDKEKKVNIKPPHFFGEKSSNWKGGKPRCKEDGCKKIISYEAVYCLRHAKRGERNYAWKGGITPINKQLRRTFEYEEWRKQVFERDLYTCQDCGQIGGYLEADHIKPFSLYPDLRTKIENGRTLCKSCHRKTETYAGRIKNYGS